ncbi:hypothetical protein JW935_26045 [candidate division KSB1 bacterium]|nr:hypothetical protein [candidate division KSB1 bacterium]
MSQYLVVFIFLVLVFVIMGAALYFSKYKKRPSSCCGGERCSSDEKEVECCGRHEGSSLE